MLKSMIVGLVLLATPVVAQEVNQCAPRQVVIDALLSAFNESVVSSGINHGPNGPVSIYELMANTENGSWSLISTTPDGVSCLLAAGSDYNSSPAQELPPNL